MIKQIRCKARITRKKVMELISLSDYSFVNVRFRLSKKTINYNTMGFNNLNKIETFVCKNKKDVYENGDYDCEDGAR